MDEQNLMRIHAGGTQPVSPDGQPATPAAATDITRPLATEPAAAAPASESNAATTPLPTDETPEESGPAADPALDRFWVAVRRMPRYLTLATSLARDPRVPRRAKALLAAGAIYTISPLDLIPGIIPVAGQLDDLLVMLVSLRQATRSCPPELAAEHLTRSGLTLADFDTDLAAARDAAIWLAKKGWRATTRLARRTGRFLRATVSSQTWGRRA